LPNEPQDNGNNDEAGDNPKKWDESPNGDIKESGSQ
jgi:hypothetical protein